jgi:NIMA (never in mitosis gene a)-related kinase
LQLTLQKIKSVVGTPYYMSPEICENKEYSFKTDIWSLGVILLEMCLLKPPFDANSLPALALKISKGEYSPVPKHYSKGLKQLVAEMMQVDPAKRPTIN